MANKVEEYKERLRAELVELNNKHELFVSQKDNMYALYQSESSEDNWKSYIEIKNKLDQVERDINHINLELLPVDKKYFNRKYYTDVDAYECIEEVTPNKYKVRQLKAIRTDDNGMSDDQQYRFESDESQPIEIIRRHKDGKFYASGDRGSRFYMSNTPHQYYDYSF